MFNVQLCRRFRRLYIGVFVVSIAVGRLQVKAFEYSCGNLNALIIHYLLITKITYIGRPTVTFIVAWRNFEGKIN